MSLCVGTLVFRVELGSEEWQSKTQEQMSPSQALCKEGQAQRATQALSVACSSHLKSIHLDACLGSDLWCAERSRREEEPAWDSPGLVAFLATSQ